MQDSQNFMMMYKDEIDSLKKIRFLRTFRPATYLQALQKVPDAKLEYQSAEPRFPEEKAYAGPSIFSSEPRQENLVQKAVSYRRR